MTISAARLNSLAPVRYNKETDSITVDWLKVWTYLAIGGIFVASATDVYASQTPHLPNPDPLPATSPDLKSSKMDPIQDKIIAASIDDLIQSGIKPAVQFSTDSVPETFTKITPKIEELSIPRESTYYSRELTKSNIINAKIDLAFGFRNNITFVPDFRVDMFKGLDQRIYSTEIVNVNGEYYKFIVRAIGMGVGGQYLETGKEMNSFLLINTPKGINTSGLLFKFNNITEVKDLIIKNGVKIQFDKDGKVMSYLNPTGILEADVNDFYQPK